MSVATSSPCDEGVINGIPKSSPMCAPCPVLARRWILATTILASGMAFIDGTVTNVALPALQTEFSASAASAQWVVESYGLFLTALLLTGGSAGDRFGRRRIFVAGVVLFALASAWCALAGSVEQLIVARAIQGVGGALLVPGSLALISTSFPEDIRGKAIGIWSGYTAITAALGPIAGGWAIEHLSWRYAFVINIPLALLILPMTFKFVPESRNMSEGPLDWQGAILASVALGCLVFGLIESSTLGWRDPLVIGALVAAPVTLIAFIAVELHNPAPMLAPALFRSRNFSGANLLTLLLYAALGGALYFFPLNLIQVQGYSATAAGAAFLPFIAIMFVLSRWAGGLVDRYGAKVPLVIGPGIAAVGFAMLALPSIGGNYWTTFFPGVVVLGLGMTITVAPLTTTVMNALDNRLSGVASGVNNAVSRAASLLAIAAFGIVMSTVFHSTFHQRVSAASVSPQILQKLIAEENKLAGIIPPPSAKLMERQAITAAVGEAYVSGFRWVMICSAVLAAASALIAWSMIDRRPRITTNR